jgi:transcriptional regulator
MYIPEVFREDRIEVLHQVIRQSGLAVLVTLGVDGLIASHVPMLLDPEPAPYGTLLGHFARPNRQAQPGVPDVQALAIFQGTEGYITPSWYPTKRQTGKVVPTWNYLAIHAYGPLVTFDDPARLLAVVKRLTERQEGGRASPWAVSDAPAAFVNAMLKGIVGFSIPLTRIEGKSKMSQNRPAEDVAGVIAGLGAEGREDLAASVARANER